MPEDMSPEQNAYPHLFEPITIGGVTFKNRIWTAPAAVHLMQGREEYPNDASYAYYSAKAAGGAAVITYSAQNMDLAAPYDGIHAHENILHPENHRFFSQFTDMIHFHDAKASLELLAFQHHGTTEDGRTIIYSLNGGDDDQGNPTVMITTAAMETIARQYADAAEAAVACGFDMLLIHAGHGLLLSQFLSPVLNQRSDEFSYEPVENRVRFLSMILDAIRARVGRRILIELRISGDEMSGDRGYHVEDCIDVLKQVQDRIDIAHVSTGLFYNGSENITHPSEFLPHGCNVKYAAAVKASPDIHIPVLTLGALQEPEQMEEIIASGQADLVAMARGLIADAQRVTKFRENRADEAIPCIRCFHCLDYRRARTFACSVNPTVGRESRLPVLERHSHPGTGKRVVIVGGGPAGMTAALTAVEKGHHPILLESSDHLGGLLRYSQSIAFKHDLTAFMDYQIHMVKKRNIDVRLNCEATPEYIRSLRPDAVVAAVGSHPYLPPIPGISSTTLGTPQADGPMVITALQAYGPRWGEACEGMRVVVIGGGLVGCETALHLATTRHAHVTVIEGRSAMATEAMYLNRDALMDRLAACSVRTITQATCTAVRRTVVFRDADGAEHHEDCDMVIVAAGMRPNAVEAEQFRGSAPVFSRIGDCMHAASLLNATRTGYDAIARL